MGYDEVIVGEGQRELIFEIVTFLGERIHPESHPTRVLANREVIALDTIRRDGC